MKPCRHVPKWLVFFLPVLIVINKWLYRNVFYFTFQKAEIFQRSAQTCIITFYHKARNNWDLVLWVTTEWRMIENRTLSDHKVEDDLGTGPPEWPQCEGWLRTGPLSDHSIRKPNHLPANLVGLVWGLLSPQMNISNETSKSICTGQRCWLPRTVKFGAEFKRPIIVSMSLSVLCYQSIGLNYFLNVNIINEILFPFMVKNLNYTNF